MVITCERLQSVFIVLILSAMILLLSCSFPYRITKKETFMDTKAQNPKMQSCYKILETVYGKEARYSNTDNALKENNLKNIIHTMSPHTAQVYSEFGTVPTLERACKIPDSKMDVFNLTKEPDTNSFSGIKCFGKLSDSTLELPYHTGDMALAESSGCLLRFDNQSSQQIGSTLDKLYSLQFKEQIEERERLQGRKTILTYDKTELTKKLTSLESTAKQLKDTYNTVNQKLTPTNEALTRKSRMNNHLKGQKKQEQNNLRSNWYSLIGNISNA